ncbi:MAG: DUF2993 domain-containing protein [bacterium]|nr:DUF2993 domain-containing protein [bacterium]
MLTLILACVLTALYAGLGAAPGLVSGSIADSLRQQVGGARKVEVRVESAPPLHMLAGHIDRLDIRMEDFKLEGVAIASASLETAPFQLKMLDTIWSGRPQLAAGADATGSVDIPEAGILAVLERPEIRSKLRGIPIQLPIFPGLPPIQRTVDVIPERVRITSDRLGIEGRLEVSGSAWPVAVSVHPQLVAPDRLSVSQLELSLAGRTFPVPSTLLQSLMPDATLDLRQLAASGPAPATPGLTPDWSLVGFAPGEGRLRLLARLRVAP